MATTNTDSARDAIFNRLDEIFSGPSSFDRISSDGSGAATPQQIGQAQAISGSTSDKEYRKLVAHLNATSYSKLGLLHECPRKYELTMLESNGACIELETELGEIVDTEPAQVNLHFAYGHAVGAGIQTFATTGNLVSAQWAAFLAWKAPWDAEFLDKKGNPTGKSLTWALYAVEKFAQFWDEHLSEWEILTLPDGRPAVELAFGVDTQNGYFHYGHIDAVLQHRETKRLAVWEGKTTGASVIKDAAYGNSYQALGYSVVIDALSQQLGLPNSDYEVFYIVYSSKEKKYQLLPFPKSLAQRAEWLQDLLLDHAMIEKYNELGFYPKRGDACVNKFGFTCKWYGTCQMRTSSLFPGAKLPVLTAVSDGKSVDYTFTLDELVAAQKNRG